MGMCVTSKCLNLARRGRAIYRYCSILSLLASYSPQNCDATNWESHKSSMAVIESGLAPLSLRGTALYTASLLETTKASLTACTIVEPYGVLRTMPMPPPCSRDDPSVSRIHLSSPTPMRMYFRPFHNKVGQHLPLNYTPRSVFYVKLTELYRPLQ